MLFSEPKIPQFSQPKRIHEPWLLVSVLFSEPKIPQFVVIFSQNFCGNWFQCSSASRKFLNCVTPLSRTVRDYSFSALQRAENSSILLLRLFRWRQNRVSVLFSEPKIPQFIRFPRTITSAGGFSALQRAENSSIIFIFVVVIFPCVRFSALQRAENSSIVIFPCVPVRFCERFSALQRAENSSIAYLCKECRKEFMFQCSSASRKFLNWTGTGTVAAGSGWFQCSSASRKFLNFLSQYLYEDDNESFSALQRAENSSIFVVRLCAI